MIDENTGLLQAVFEDDSEKVKKIIKEHGAVQADLLQEILMWAAVEGSAETVKMLLCFGADYDFKYGAGSKAAQYAALSGRKNTKAVLKAFIDAGMHPDCAGYNDNTPLIESAFSGKTDCCEYLLKLGADIEFKNVKGNTPLISAAKNGHAETVKLLLEYGADTTVKGRSYPAAVNPGKHFDEIHSDTVTMYELNDAADSSASEMAHKNGHHEIALLIEGASCIEGKRKREIIDALWHKDAQKIVELADRGLLTPNQGYLCCACCLHYGSVKIMEERGGNMFLEAFAAVAGCGSLKIIESKWGNSAVHLGYYLFEKIEKKGEIN